MFERKLTIMLSSGIVYPGPKLTTQNTGSPPFWTIKPCLRIVDKGGNAQDR